MYVCLKIFPIVPVLCIVILIIEDSNNVKHGEPPLGVRFIPNGSDLSVIEESNGYFTHSI